MIEVKNIVRRFDTLEVLKGVNLTIQPREIVSIVGASGAGKTTLLQIMGTLDLPNAGEVLYEGENLLKLSEASLAKFRNKHIGFVFQFHQLLPEFTALENVMLPALIGGVKWTEARKKAAELLDYLQLAQRLEHKPNELSGGEKQRVAVARALVNSPQVIYADEPSGSLDSKNKEELHQLFLNLRHEMNCTFVIVTHDSALAQIGDRVIHMKDGSIAD